MFKSGFCGESKKTLAILMGDTERVMRAAVIHRSLHAPVRGLRFELH